MVDIHFILFYFILFLSVWSCSSSAVICHFSMHKPLLKPISQLDRSQKAIN